MQRQIRHFQGIGSDGRDYDFTETTNIKAAGTLEDPGATTESLPAFTLPDGGCLNRLNATEFLTVPRGVIVRVKG